jgi:prevent-host-death family protein
MAIIKSIVARIVGIKELKDKASSIIDAVERHGEAVSITRNNREVARIIPAAQEPLQRLIESGRIASIPRLKWDAVEIKKLKVAKNADKAIASIISDRGED